MVTQSERRASTSHALRLAARELFGTRGFDHVSVDDIAAAAGVTRGALYHYFDSKEQLFEAVFEEVETGLVERVVRASFTSTDSEQRLRDGCDAFIDATADRELSRIALIDAPAVLGWFRYRELDEQHFLALLRTAIDAVRDSAPAEDNEMIARALLGGLRELAVRAATHPGERAAAKRAAGMLVAAVARPL